MLQEGLFGRPRRAAATASWRAAAAAGELARRGGLWRCCGVVPESPLYGTTRAERGPCLPLVNFEWTLFLKCT